MEEITKHYLISGRVQGVGFRAFTRRVAGELKLRGWVRNLIDGRVETLVQGPQSAVYLFEAKLKAGPAHGHVENLVDEEFKLAALSGDFEVRKDGSLPWSQK